MKIDLQTVKPNLDSIDPELIFTFSISKKHQFQIPLSFSGDLLSQDGKLLCNLIQQKNQNVFELELKGVSIDADSSTFKLILKAGLSEKAIHYIEEHRITNNQKDKSVKFTLNLKASIISSSLQISHLYTDNNKDMGGYQKVLYKYSNGYSNAQTDMFIISTSGSEKVLELMEAVFYSYNIEIGLMDWINIFIPYFKLGKIFVYEFIEPPYSHVPKAIKKQFEKAQNSIEAMKKSMAMGDWKTTVSQAREIYEAFKDLDEFKKLLINSGYSEPAFEAIKNGLKGIFDFVSKGIHVYGKGKASDININPDFEVHKEDAYFIYSNCISVLNLISQKAKRLEY